VAESDTATDLMAFSATLTKDQQRRLLQIIRKPSFRQEHVPRTVYYLRKLEQYRLQRLKKTTFEFTLTENQKVHLSHF
jgi:hypothetical protein